MTNLVWSGISPFKILHLNIMTRMVWSQDGHIKRCLLYYVLSNIHFFVKVLSNIHLIIDTILPLEVIFFLKTSNQLYFAIEQFSKVSYLLFLI